MFTFKANSSKSNAKRFLTQTAKVADFEQYLTQHANQWGTWLDAEGKPVPSAQAVEGVFAAAKVDAPVAAALPADATAADTQEDDTPAPGPSASAFAAFALGQLAGNKDEAAQAATPAPAPRASSREGATPTAGLKIQKDRPMQNGIRRQSAGSVGDQLWALYDAAGPDLSLEHAKNLAAGAGLSTTSAAIALYNWRKFHGIASRPMKKA